MMFFTVYNQNTGQIYKTGMCLAEDFELQAGGYSVAEGNYPDDKYYWDNGFVPIPAKPEGFYYFDYSTKQWEPDIEKASNDAIAKRNKLLYESDWTQLPNGPLTPEQVEQWAVYRQALRDVPQQEGFPMNIVWPVSP